MFVTKLTHNQLVNSVFFLPSSMTKHAMYGRVYMLKHKDEVFNHFVEWKTLVEKQRG